MPPRKKAAPASKRKPSAATKATKAAPRKKVPAADKLARHVATLTKAGHDKAEIVAALRHAIANVEPMTEYSQALADEICLRMALGETVSKICDDEHMPDKVVVYRWRAARPDFNQSYARARVDQMHAWSDEIITLADGDGLESDFNFTVPLDHKDLERIESAGYIRFRYKKTHVSRAELMIKTRQWLMSRLAAEDFGDKSSVSVTVQYEDKDDAELMQELRAAADKAGVTPEMLALMLGTEGIAQ